MKLLPTCGALVLLGIAASACSGDPFDSCVPGQGRAAEIGAQCCFLRGHVGGYTPATSVSGSDAGAVSEPGPRSVDDAEPTLEPMEDADLEAQGRRGWYGRGYYGSSRGGPWGYGGGWGAWRAGFAPSRGWAYSGGTYVWVGPPGSIYTCPTGHAFVAAPARP